VALSNYDPPAAENVASFYSLRMPTAP